MGGPPAKGPPGGGKTMTIKIRILGGRWGDFTQLEDRACLRAVVESGGKHEGHEVRIYSEKYNCGSAGYYIECSCGSRWWSRLSGCPDHTRPEGGDRTLREIIYGEVEKG